MRALDRLLRLRHMKRDAGGPVGVRLRLVEPVVGDDLVEAVRRSEDGERAVAELVGVREQIALGGGVHRRLARADEHRRPGHRALGMRHGLAGEERRVDGDRAEHLLGVDAVEAVRPLADPAARAVHVEAAEALLVGQQQRRMQVAGDDLQPLEPLQLADHRRDRRPRIQNDAHPVLDMPRRRPGDRQLLGAVLARPLVVAGAHEALHLDRSSMRALDLALRLQLLQIPADRHLRDLERLRQLRDRRLLPELEQLHDLMLPRSHEHDRFPPSIPQQPALGFFLLLALSCIIA